MIVLLFQASTSISNVYYYCYCLELVCFWAMRFACLTTATKGIFFVFLLFCLLW